MDNHKSYNSYTDTIEHDDFPIQEHTAPNYLRPILAVVLVLILLTGTAYSAVAPWLRQQLSPIGDEFEIVLTGISGQACQDAPHVTLQGSLEPTETLCICGQLYTTEANVDYWLYLYTETGRVWARQSVKNQQQGAFCRVWHLPEPLNIGRYALAILPHPRREPTNRLWFSVRQPYSPSASVSSSVSVALGLP